MASVSTDANGLRRILFVDRNGSRKAIRLGRATKRDADSFKVKLESLLSAKLLGNSPDRETSVWLLGLSDDLHGKLAEFQLVEPRRPKSDCTLAGFVDSFIAGRTDMKQTTLDHYRRGRNCLVEFFGAEKRIVDVTAFDADQFRSWLKGTKKHAENTVRGHLKNSKLFFGAAVRAKLIDENPFKGISSQLVKRPDRMAFVATETIQKVLKACPTTRWKAIITLCRYAGMRCPSEVLALQWSDVDFDGNRMQVRSPKGEGFGKGVREVPLFPEVRKVLEELHMEPIGGDYVITCNDRSGAKNLRTVFDKILKKAGVVPWPRLFQNLRSSREIELAEQYPVHVITAWLGHTPKVAMEHYLKVRDTDFAKAAQNPAQYSSATPGTAPYSAPPENEKPRVSQEKPTKQGVCKIKKAPRLGDECLVDAMTESEISDDTGAESGAVVARDADLVRLIRCWPRLTNEIRKALADRAEDIAEGRIAYAK